MTTRTLSPRELAVIAAIAAGHERDQTAVLLGISRSTVNTYIRRAYDTLGARNSAHAVHLAHRAGLLPAGDT